MCKEEYYCCIIRRKKTKKCKRDLNDDFDKFLSISCSKLSFYVNEIYEYISSCLYPLSPISIHPLLTFEMTNASGSIVLTSSYFFAEISSSNINWKP